MSAFLTITIIIMLAAISPGPDFAVVTKNALSYSRKAGIYTALGVALSLIFHASYCMLGLAIIVSKSLLLFSFIKYLGAAYLIYIGIKALLDKSKMQIANYQHTHKTMANFKALQQGFLCNALNPKAIFFLLALFTMVIKPNTPVWLQGIYAIDVALIHFIWFSILSIIITHHRIKKGLSKIQHYIVKVMGAFLIGFGCRIAMLAHK
jgi:RhtB (resistance to homoserine/threonine) family protein